MAKTVRLSSKRQISIPKAICEKLGVDRGQELILEEEGGRIILQPKPKNYARALRGLGKRFWKNIDPLEYIRQERARWDKKPSLPR